MGMPEEFNSYEEYVDFIQDAIEAKGKKLLSVQLSEIEKTDELNATLGETFAKFVDERFVDAEIKFVDTKIPADSRSFVEIFGFAYDKEGKSYSYTLQIIPEASHIATSRKKLIENINDGFSVKSNFVMFNSISKTIDSVYTKTTENTNE